MTTLEVFQQVSAGNMTAEAGTEIIMEMRKLREEAEPTARMKWYAVFALLGALGLGLMGWTCGESMGSVPHNHVDSSGKVWEFKVPKG